MGNVHHGGDLLDRDRVDIHDDPVLPRERDMRTFRFEKGKDQGNLDLYVLRDLVPNRCDPQRSPDHEFLTRRHRKRILLFGRLSVWDQRFGRRLLSCVRQGSVCNYVSIDPCRYGIRHPFLYGVAGIQRSRPGAATRTRSARFGPRSFGK